VAVLELWTVELAFVETLGLLSFFHSLRMDVTPAFAIDAIEGFTGEWLS
jgi:hypothetical protein